MIHEHTSAMIREAYQPADDAEPAHRTAFLAAFVLGEPLPPWAVGALSWLATSAAWHDADARVGQTERYPHA